MHSGFQPPAHVGRTWGVQVARQAPEVEPLRVAAVRFSEKAGAQIEEAWFLNRQSARQRNEPVLYPDFPPFRELVVKPKPYLGAPASFQEALAPALSCVRARDLDFSGGCKTNSQDMCLSAIQ